MSLYTPTGLIGGSESRFTLKKLPMWGEQVAADAINFEWPTQEIFEKWP